MFPWKQPQSTSFVIEITFLLRLSCNRKQIKNALIPVHSSICTSIPGNFGMHEVLLLSGGVSMPDLMLLGQIKSFHVTCRFDVGQKLFFPLDGLQEWDQIPRAKIHPMFRHPPPPLSWSLYFTSHSLELHAQA